MRSPTPRSAVPPRRELRRGVVALVVALVALVGCVPTGERPELVGDPVEAATINGTTPCPPPVEPFVGFGSTVVVVVGDQGPLERCVLVADTLALRSRGLMEVDGIGDYDGMIFVFPEDTTGGFWMGNTYLPLSIAFVDATGVVVTVHDMEPCPAAVDCPDYLPDAPYRWAVEVPQGELEAFGLRVGSRLAVETLPVAVP